MVGHVKEEITYSAEHSTMREHVAAVTLDTFFIKANVVLSINQLAQPFTMPNAVHRNQNNYADKGGQHELITTIILLIPLQSSYQLIIYCD